MSDPRGRLLVDIANYAGPPSMLPVDLAAEYLSYLGLNGPRESLVAIERSDAESGLISICIRTLSYEDDVMTSGVAATLVARWFDALGGVAHLFTLGGALLGHRDGVSYTMSGYVTGATFEAGVVGVSSAAVGVFWASDED